jgi:FxsC-like protein
VTTLFRDLCKRVRQLNGLPVSADVGFMDRELRINHHWPAELARALATSRVFVPLYSRRYFQSEDCGKEWYAFRQRALTHSSRGDNRVESIIPALWVPVDRRFLPPAARDFNFDHSDFGDTYAAEGFYRIIKLSKHRETYERAVDKLAERIVETAKYAPAAPESPIDYAALPNAFGNALPAMPGDVPLRITIVAPCCGRLPEGRNAGHYGRAARDWNPYASPSSPVLADYVANLARSLGYRPYVGGIEDHEADLLSSGPPQSPEVLLVDPWAPTQDDCSILLRELDALDKPWVQVVVAWSSDDEESTAAEGKLRQALEYALRRKLADGRATSSLAVRGVPSLEALGKVLPAVIKTASDHYLKHAKAFPPDGPGPERPRLSLLTKDSSDTETLSA